MERRIELNGKVYSQVPQDFDHVAESVVMLLGEEMFAALSEAQAIIAGGAVLSTFTHQEVSDVDVYFRSKESMAKAFDRITKEWDSVYLGHTDKSITLKDRETDRLVQFIHFDYFKDADAVFEAFDFTVCMAAVELSNELDYAGYELVLHPNFLADALSRTLHFNNGTRFPYVSLIRTKKYQERGYKIGRGGLVAIGVACAQHPINSWEDAKYQLGGVYGHEINLEIEENTEFSQDKLHEVITSLKEYKFLESKATQTNYDRIYKEIVGRSPGEAREADN